MSDEVEEPEPTQEEREETQIKFWANEIGPGLEDRAKTAAKQFLNGAAEDVAQFSEAMIEDYSIAAAVGDTEVMSEIEGQWRSLAEKHRVYGSRQAWALFTDSVGGAARMASLVIRVAAVAIA